MLAIQNATPPENLGVATSTVTFFRSLGSSLGGALFGTVLISRLTHYISQSLPHAGEIVHSATSSGTRNLPTSAKQVVLQSYVHSFHDLFILVLPVVAAAFIVAIFLREVPLRGSAQAMARAETLE